MKYDDQLKLLCISLSQCMPIVRKQKMCPCSCCCCATNDYTSVQQQHGRVCDNVRLSLRLRGSKQAGTLIINVTYIYMQTCTGAQPHAHKCACMCVYVCVFVCVCTCTHKRTTKRERETK